MSKKGITPRGVAGAVKRLQKAVDGKPHIGIRGDTPKDDALMIWLKASDARDLRTIIEAALKWRPAKD